MRLVPSFLRTILPFVRQFPLLKFAFVPPLRPFYPTFLYPFPRTGDLWNCFSRVGTDSFEK